MTRSRPDEVAPTAPSSPCVRVQRVPGAEVALVFFAGMNGRVGGEPAFELMRTAERLGVTAAFLRDPKERWYLTGIPEVGGDVAEVTRWLRALRAGESVRRLVFVGGSSGGYAALLYGALAGADHVIGFSPQTWLADHRWTRRPQNLTAVHDLLGRDHPCLDLQGLFCREERGGALPRVDLVWSAWNRIDRRHARRLAPWARLMPIAGARHNSLRRLRDWDLLVPLLAGAARGDPFDLPSAVRKVRRAWLATAEDLAWLTGRSLRGIRRRSEHAAAG